MARAVAPALHRDEVALIAEHLIHHIHDRGRPHKREES